MRTTITLDPDVESLIKKRMRDGRLSFKDAVNEAIRTALAPKHRADVSFPTFHMGRIEVPGHKYLQLAAELDDEHLLETMRAARARGTRKRSRSTT